MSEFRRVIVSTRRKFYLTRRGITWQIYLLVILGNMEINTIA